MRGGSPRTGTAFAATRECGPALCERRGGYGRRATHSPSIDRCRSRRCRADHASIPHGSSCPQPPRVRTLLVSAAIAALAVTTSVAWRSASTPYGTRAVAVPMAMAAVAAPGRPAESTPTPVAREAPTMTPLARPAPTIGKIKVTVVGRRIFVDGHFIGEGPVTLPLWCGTHKVKVGRAGAVRSIDVPCGNEIAIGSH
jgi:hypothetical protein